VAGADRTVDERGSVVLGPMVVGDIDALRDPAWLGEVTLTAGNGTLSLPAGVLGQLVFIQGDGSDDATVTFRGSLSALNTALAVSRTGRTRFTTRAIRMPTTWFRTWCT
jgi:hypothetical protein